MNYNMLACHVQNHKNQNIKTDNPTDIYFIKKKKKSAMGILPILKSHTSLTRDKVRTTNTHISLSKRNQKWGMRLLPIFINISSPLHNKLINIIIHTINERIENRCSTLYVLLEKMSLV